MPPLSLKIEPYTLHFTTPFQFGKNVIESKSGFLIKIEENDIVAIGDLAPFELLGTESAQAAISRFYEIESNFISEVKDGLINAHQFIENSTENFPALKSALTQVTLSYYTKKNKLSIFELLGVCGKSDVPTNAILGVEELNNSLNTVAKLILRGFKTIKIKIGHSNFDETMKLLSFVREKYGQTLKIRLDANSVWKYSEALEYLKKLSQFSIEYIEQPTGDIYKFKDMERECGILIAADESMVNFEQAKNVISKNLASVIIIKPVLYGGIIKSIELIKLAERNGIIPIVTTAFESYFGRRTAIFLSSLLKHDYACGLATGRLFKKDVVLDNSFFINGNINMADFQI